MITGTAPTPDAEKNILCLVAEGKLPLFRDGLMDPLTVSLYLRERIKLTRDELAIIYEMQSNPPDIELGEFEAIDHRRRDLFMEYLMLTWINGRLRDAGIIPPEAFRRGST